MLPNATHPDSRVRNQRWWHLTTNPRWAYDPQHTPVDSVRGVWDEPGRLYVTGDDMLRYWLPWFPEDTPLYAAEIDMADLRPSDRDATEGDYRDPTKRGFIGYPELRIDRADRVKVLRLVSFEQALREADAR